MDNFDEFEFKPITEGLGFHKKNQKQKLDLSDTIRGKTMPSAPGTRSQFSKIPEERTAPRPQAPSAPTNLQRPRTQPQYKINQTEFVEEPKAIQQPRQFNKEEISTALPSIFFDSIVILGLTGLFLFATFLIARVDPINVIKMIPNDRMTALGVGVLVMSLIQGYLLISRSFFGSTLGEWAFEIEVGTPDEQLSALYPIRILWRSLVTTATGLVLLPILSMVLRQDLGGKISGVYLYRG